MLTQCGILCSAIAKALILLWVSYWLLWVAPRRRHFWLLVALTECIVPGYYVTTMQVRTLSCSQHCFA